MLIYKATYQCTDPVKGTSTSAKYFKTENRAKKGRAPIEEAAKGLGVGIAATVEEITVED